MDKISLLFWLTIITLIFYYLKRRLTYWQRRGIPHDKPHPIYGNMKGVRKTRNLHDIVEEIYAKYKGTGPFCGIYFMQQPRVFVLETELARKILIKDFSKFTDRGLYHNERDDPLTGHLFALDGAKWKQLRQKLTPTFTGGKMKFMFPTVVKVGEKLIEVVDDLLKTNNEFEMRELLARFTTDVIGTCAFGIECNSLQDPNAEFLRMGRLSFQKSRHHFLIITLMMAFPDVARTFHMRAIPDDIHEFFLRIVRETINLRKAHKITRNDFMDLLIELKNAEKVKLESGEEVQGLSLEEVAAQAFVFFVAGFETSSTAMTFILYELAKHQDMQDRARKEINDVIKANEDTFSYECLKELKYMEQIIAETLRLHTIVSHLNRKALTDYIVDDNPKYLIEKGTRIMIPACAVHHDPNIYPEPLKFDPERFAPETAAQRDSLHWLPFGEGPRNCIGMRFAQMQMRIGLTLLLKNFKFQTCAATPDPIVYDKKSIFLSPKDGLTLSVERL